MVFATYLSTNGSASIWYANGGGGRVYTSPSIHTTRPSTVAQTVRWNSKNYSSIGKSNAHSTQIKWSAFITSRGCGSGKSGRHPYKDTEIDPSLHKLEIRKDMDLNKRETIDQIYLSPDPLFDAFEEQVNIAQWTTLDHRTAGFCLIKRDNRLVIGSIKPSTTAAKIPRWWLMKVGDDDVETAEQVFQGLARAKAKKKSQWGCGNVLIWLDKILKLL